MIQFICNSENIQFFLVTVSNFGNLRPSVRRSIPRRERRNTHIYIHTHAHIRESKKDLRNPRKSADSFLVNAIAR